MQKRPRKGVKRSPLPYPDLHYQRDCGMFIVAFAEFLSDEINVSYDSFRSDYLRKRYATVLWKYGLDKSNAGYVSDNNDPPRLKSVLNPVAENELVNVG
ncbi:hypothetical protein H5410_047711 [Solanum commersonii]|uniref:Ulp1 protease family, C-terminal catalytic domain containing protein n=1 Tax=Solanum commersonii TaxID=4109 RepID=A0A9J5XHS9_SOLCO|nr:hypothetical protein H5410_047711 [Solanum commersonii]